MSRTFYVFQEKYIIVIILTNCLIIPIFFRVFQTLCQDPDPLQATPVGVIYPIWKGKNETAFHFMTQISKIFRRKPGLEERMKPEEK